MSAWRAANPRWRALLTGRVSWDDNAGHTETESLSWSDRWAIFGAHSYNWWWVRKFGQLRCGCARNPVTRRMVLMAMDCPQHGFGWDRVKGCDDTCGCATGFDPTGDEFHCLCGDPQATGVVHSTDGPCYHIDPQGGTDG